MALAPVPMTATLLPQSEVTTQSVVRPSLWTGSLLNTADNGFNYSINQSAKEALYVPTSPTEKYQAKAFIDMFVQRFAKTAGIVASLGMSRWFSDAGSIRWLSFVSIAVIAVWVMAVRYAGRAFEERGGSGRPSEGKDEPRPVVPRHDVKAGAGR